MADFNKTVDLDKGLNKILDKIDDRAEELRRRGEDAGESFGYGWDEGLDTTVEKIKASSIKMEKAFSNLSEKIRKQVQQLTTKVNGKDFKLKIDFSDIDINSDDIKNKVARIVKDISTEGLIEFDAKGSEQQFKNLITLYVKYQEKLNNLQDAAPNLTSSKDIELNLRQQLMLALKLKEIYSFLDSPGSIKGYSMEIKKMADQLVTVQKVVKQTSGGDTKVAGDYKELAEILKEIQGSLQVISDTFANENNSMKAMAENGKTSFESLSQAIIEVYNNLTQVQGLVDTISKKDFNITNITQTGGGNSNLQVMKQQMAIARETMEHLRSLYDQAGDTLQMLGDNGQVGLVFEYSKQLQELSLTDISKSVKGANSEMKLASVLAEMQDYIDKLTQINELRNKYKLGEWKDTFVPTQKPVAKPTVQEKSQVVVEPTITQPQNVVGTSNTEAQQMWQLKAAVDEVTNAIGRKNAGFIKEQEIVNASVEAEKAKLRELVDVITNEIGNALDGIKAKFAQSFVVPELDKNSLQTSFDEIYNKFVELKDKIQTMQIDIGVNTANITTAIQEALYAKEIAANYNKSSFSDIFHTNPFIPDVYFNNLTGEALSKSEAEDIWAKNDLFVDKSGNAIGDIQDVIQDIISKSNSNAASEQNDWAQVIVEAINTQGGKIVESIKLLLPKNISSGVDGDIIDETKLSDAFNVLVQAIADFGNQTGVKPRGFFERIRDNDPDANRIRTPEVDDALRTLGLLSEAGEIQLTIPDTGLRNLGVAIGDKVVATSQDKWNAGGSSDLKKRLDEAYQLGASVPRILSLIEKDNIPAGFGGTTDAIFQLQERAPGVNIHSSDAHNEFLGASTEQIDRLIHTFEVMSKVGLYPDFIGDNILFDNKKGFSLVDLETDNIQSDSMDTPQDMVKAFLTNLFRGANEYVDPKDEAQFKQLVKSRLNLPPEKRLVNADTIAAERSTANQAQDVTRPTDVKITPTMDEGAVAKVVEDNVAKTPVTVKVTPVINEESTNPTKSELDQTMDFLNSESEKYGIDGYEFDDNLIIDSASNTQQAIDGETQSAVDAAKTFVDAANAKKQFVEANKQVADSAKTSENAVKKEAEAAKVVAADVSNVAKDLAKTKDVFNDAGELIQTDTTKKFKTDKAIVTETDSTKIMRDDDGNETTSTITTIVNDFETLAKETKKSEEAVARAQKKLDEFLARFQSKSGGNAKFISGFSDLEGTTVTSDNMEDVFNKMIKLQEEYSKLETNFRKGQSSLNPFVNALTKSENIGNIFGDIERQFNGLTNKSDELVGNFTKLQELTKKIQEFTQRMNSNPDSILPGDFSEFSKQVGEFNVLKSQVEGSIKTEKKIEVDNEKLRKKEVQDYINLVKQMYEYDAKAAKGGSMQSIYEAKVAKLKDEIVASDKLSIMNQEEKNKLLALEEAHQLKIAEIKLKSATGVGAGKQSIATLNDKLQGKYQAGYLSEANFSNWQNELAIYQSYLDGTVKADEATVQQKKAELTKLFDYLNKISNASRTFFASGGEILSKWFSPDEIKNAESSLRGLYDTIVSDRFSGMETSVTGVNETLGRLTFTVNTGKGALEQYTIQMDKASGAAKLLSGNTKETLTTTQSFIKALKGDAKGLFSAFIGGMSTMYAVGRYFKEGIQYVRELDKALTELKKVTDETEETYDRFLETAGKTSTRIGSTLSNMTSATAEFAKLGYNIDTAAAMAESALVYTNVGDNVDVETGSQSIISTLKAFGIEAENTMSIVDKFNEVGKLVALR